MLKREIQEGGMAPAWYGVAWRDHNRRSVICYPIVLNIIVSFLRSVYISIRFGNMTISCDPRDAYQQGFRNGLDLGREIMSTAGLKSIEKLKEDLDKDKPVNETDPLHKP